MTSTANAFESLTVKTSDHNSSIKVGVETVAVIIKVPLR